MTDGQITPLFYDKEPILGNERLDDEKLSPEAFDILQSGMQLFKEKRIDEAEAAIVQAIEIHPRLAPVYNVFALLKIAQRGMDALKESVYHAMTTNPEFMDDFIKEGLQLQSQGDLEGAEERFKKAIALNPDNLEAYFKLGFLHVTQRKYKSATDIFEELIMMDPENINAFFMLGTSYSELREFYPAISNLQYALRMKPDFVEARLTLAEAYHNQGKYLISLDELNVLENYIPQEDTTYLHRGLIKMELEEFDEAIPFFEKAITVNPQLLEAYELLMGLYENQGRKDDARLVAERGLELDPDNQDLKMALERLDVDDKPKNISHEA